MSEVTVPQRVLNKTNTEPEQNKTTFKKYNSVKMKTSEQYTSNFKNKCGIFTKMHEEIEN